MTSSPRHALKLPATSALLALLIVLALAGAGALQSSALARTAAPARARTASTHAQIGISDNSAAIFSDPRFKWLGVRTARLIVSWDIVKHRAELAWDTAWLKEARAHKVTPLVVFETDPSHPTLEPSLASYGSAVHSFMKLFPWVHDYTPWNEENHFSQPTYKDPLRAAQYFNLLSIYCPSCVITAADVLDEPNMAEWVTKFLHYAHHPRVWGLHNYADLSSGENWRTALLLSIVPGAVWFTETGGVVWRYERGSHTYVVHSETFAAKAAGNLLALAAISPRVTRIYYYQWRVPETLSWVHKHGQITWDSGLISPNCAVRPAFSVIARAIGRNTAHIPRAKRDAANNCI